MNYKLGVVSIPQPGDLVSIMTKDGKSLYGQVVNWGAEEWDERWATCRVFDDQGEQSEQLIQINIGNISTYSLHKQSTYAQQYKIVGRGEGDAQPEERVVNAQTQQPAAYRIVKHGENEPQKVVNAAPVFTRRIAKTGKAVIEEGVATHHHLSMDPVERARLLAHQQNQRAGLHREKVKDHMARKDIERVKQNYEVPSFKKRSED